RAHCYIRYHKPYSHSPNLCPKVIHHVVEAGTDRAMPDNAIPHRLDIVGPGDAEERGIVHQELPVRAENVDQADIARGERAAFLTRQLVPIEQSFKIGMVSPLDTRVASDVVQEFLQLIQAHEAIPRLRCGASGTTVRDVM